MSRNIKERKLIRDVISCLPAEKTLFRTKETKRNHFCFTETPEICCLRFEVVTDGEDAGVHAESLTHDWTNGSWWSVM